MAFPTTPSLDNFNTDPPSTALTSIPGWTNAPLRTGDASLSTDSVPTKAVAAATAGNLWAGSLNVDSETWLTIDTYTPASQQIYCCTRVVVQGTLTCYALQIGAPASTFILLKFVAGAGSAIGVSKGITAAPGDSIGIQVIGNQIGSFYKPAAGAWSQQDLLTDNSIVLPGRFGGFFCSAGVAIDEVGGGAYAAPQTRQVGSWMTSQAHGG